MSPDALLRMIRQRAASGDYVLSHEAIERTREAGYSPGDVRHALTKATRCAASGTARWIVHGSSLEGTEMAIFIVVAGDGDVTVV